MEGAEESPVAILRAILGIGPFDASDEELQRDLDQASGNVEVAIDRYFNAQAAATSPPPRPRNPPSPCEWVLGIFFFHFIVF